MRKYILPAFAVATVAILAGAAVAEGRGGAVKSAPIHGRVAITPAPKLTVQGLRGPVPGEASVQAQVFGDLAQAPRPATIQEVGR